MNSLFWPTVKRDTEPHGSRSYRVSCQEAESRPEVRPDCPTARPTPVNHFLQDPLAKSRPACGDQMFTPRREEEDIWPSNPSSGKQDHNSKG